MKRDLMKALGRNYTLDGNSITDNRVSGFSSERNVAQIRESKGVLYVNVYKGYFYKPGEEKGFSDVGEAMLYILARGTKE